MTALAMTSNNCKLQTHPIVTEDLTYTITESVKLENKITGREPQGACRQDELIGRKPPVVK
jgi:hypothetical protein